MGEYSGVLQTISEGQYQIKQYAEKFRELGSLLRDQRGEVAIGIITKTWEKSRSWGVSNDGGLYFDAPKRVEMPHDLVDQFSAVLQKTAVASDRKDQIDKALTGIGYASLIKSIS